MSLRLQGKVALVTGAAQRIGKEIAILFAKEGAKIIVTDIDDAAGVLVVKDIGEKAAYFHLDVSKESEWERVISDVIVKFGELNILVNNAGITGFQEGFGPQDPEHASLSSWRSVHSVNSEGVFLGCKLGIQKMKDFKNGSIINISSRSGLVGIPGAAAYAASKAAVRNHTKTVALYCADKGYQIRCNSIHPAAILTPMWEPMLGSGPVREKNMAGITSSIPLKRMGIPEDVAYSALFLASDESKYITGIELTVDGGILAGAGAPPKKTD